MRICLVSHYSKPHIGGIESLVHMEAQGLVKLGHHVTHLSSKLSGEPTFANTYGYLLHRVNALNLLERLFGIPYPLFSPNFIHILGKHLLHTDICLIHGSGFLSSLMAAIMCRRIHTPYVVLQNSSFIDFKNPVIKILQKMNDEYIASFVVHNASKIAAVSQESCQYIQAYSDCKCTLLNNASDPTIFFPTAEKTEIRKQLNLPLRKIIILTTGRLVYKRGTDTFLEVANKLKDETALHFLIVGDGPERSKLKKFARDNGLTNCTFKGSVSHDSIADYYRAADIFVITSRTGEGFPIAIIEAWLTKLPVIATTSGGHQTIIQNNYNGFLVAPESIDGICANILLLQQEHEIYNQIGSNGWETAQEKFTTKTHIKQLENLLLAAFGEATYIS